MPLRDCAPHRIYGLFERGDFGDRRTTVYRSGPLSFRWWDKRLELSLTRTPKRLYRRNDLSDGFEADRRLSPETAVLRVVRKLEADLTPHRAPSRSATTPRKYATVCQVGRGADGWGGHRLRPRSMSGSLPRPVRSVGRFGEQRMWVGNQAGCSTNKLGIRARGLIGVSSGHGEQSSGAGAAEKIGI